MLTPQAAISTPGPAPFYDRTGMSEARAKKLFAQKTVWELMDMFKMSRSSVFHWRKQWGITKRVTSSEDGFSRVKEHQRLRRERIEKELAPEIVQLRADREELIQLRAENAVLQRLVRDLTLEVARLGGRKKR